ncbi:MAG: hypothetical protein LAD29_13240 [Rhodoferax sp.]|nr:hypothetical protein [Rhodoferax sp.]
MLRLFRDTLHIGLFADRVVLVRVSGGLRGRSTAQKTETVLSADDATSAAATLDALQQLLQEPRWQGADARVQVSNALVHYAIVPASDMLLSAADEMALAQLKFRQMHGGGDTEWDIRLGNLLSGQDQIAAALEGGFVQRLREILKEADSRLCSLEPLLMSTFNRVRRQLVGSDFWFALAEPGLLMLARLQGANWLSLAAVTMDEPLAWVLPTQLAEARLMAGTPSQAARVYLYAPGVDCAGCHAGPDMELVNLSDTKKLDPLAGAQVLGLEH